MIRQARDPDLPSLLSLATAAFGHGQFHARQLTRFIRYKRVWLWDTPAGIEGFVIFLQHRGTHIARIYALVVDPAAQRQGIGSRLLRFCERLALDNGYLDIRLEVRLDNVPAQKLYDRFGYRPLKLLFGYYLDDAAGMRMYKRLAPQRPVSLPAYQQQAAADGPACLLMAMHRLNQRLPLTPDTEAELARQALAERATRRRYCLPGELARVARRHGFIVETWGTDSAEGEPSALSAIAASPRLSTLAAQLAPGVSVMVRLPRGPLAVGRLAGWVLVTAIDERYVWYFDPDPQAQRNLAATDGLIALRRDRFARMLDSARAGTGAGLIIRAGALAGRTLEALPAPDLISTGIEFAPQFPSQCPATP